MPWRRAWQPTPVFLPGESPWTEEPGGLQSMGLQRVGHDWATKHSTVRSPQNSFLLKTSKLGKRMIGCKKNYRLSWGLKWMDGNCISATLLVSNYSASWQFHFQTFGFEPWVVSQQGDDFLLVSASLASAGGWPAPCWHRPCVRPYVCELLADENCAPRMQTGVCSLVTPDELCAICS